MNNKTVQQPDEFSPATEKKKSCFTLADYLGYGKGKAISAERLVNLLGLNSTRELRLMIHRARIEGALIASCEQGYFLPATRAEIIEYKLRFEKMGTSILACLKPAREALEEIEGQGNF